MACRKWGRLFEAPIRFSHSSSLGRFSHIFRKNSLQDPRTVEDIENYNDLFVLCFNQVDETRALDNWERQMKMRKREQKHIAGEIKR